MITISTKSYKVYINNYTYREADDVGFEVEIEYKGEVFNFAYDKKVVSNVIVAKFEYSKTNGITFIKSIPASKSSREIWGVNTNKFQKVSMIMNSPNYWDGQHKGNKHVFFILEGCKNENKSRGLYNEFLKDDLHEHRKVFEVLGSKMKTDRSNNQLSGIGFSSTQKNSVLFKVTGSFTRALKVNF